MAENESKLAATLEYILDRLKEPSTWAGIAIFIGSFGLDQNTVDRLVQNGPTIAVGAAALIAVIAPSSGRRAIKKAEEVKEKVEVVDTKVSTLFSDPTIIR